MVINDRIIRPPMCLEGYSIRLLKRVMMDLILAESELKPLTSAGTKYQANGDAAEG